MNCRRHWQLDPDLDFLNHGSFGATPTVVLQAQRVFQDALERDPIEFLAPERKLLPQLDLVRDCVARLVGATADDIAWVRNATDGVNAVVRSFPFESGDEIVITNHGYNACNNAARYAAQLRGATVRVAHIPFPLTSAEQVLDAIERTLTDRTRLLLVDHVSSPTGLVFPIHEIVALAQEHRVRVLVDGAHAPGMLPLDLQAMNADYYTANHHKWLCAPKASGFLWVKRQWQDEVRPTVISHAANRILPGRSRFISEFDWTGTFDPSPLLALPAAIQFLGSLFPDGIEALMKSNHRLALESRDVLLEALDIDAPAPDAMLGSLIAVPLPPSSGPAAPASLDPLQIVLRQQHRFELPIYSGPEPGSRLLRISLHAYNDLEQVKRLGKVLRAELT